MKVVNPNNVSHTISLIPRFYSDDLILELYNETTRAETTVVNTVLIVDGILSMSFDFSFSENDKFQIKISKDSEILYRGKLIATTQPPQEYKLTNGLYYYE